MQENQSELFATAMVKSLERQRNEALTREASKDAALVVLQAQLSEAVQRRNELAAELNELRSAFDRFNRPAAAPATDAAPV